MSHLLPDMIDKSLPSVISAKLLFRRAAAPSLPLLLLLIVLLTTGLPQPVSSFTAAVYGVSQTYHDKFYSRRNCLTPLRLLQNKNSQADVIFIMFHIATKDLRVFKFEYNMREFSTRGKGKIFVQRIYVISGLSLLAILLSEVDHAKGKLGWKLRLAARFERPVMSK